MHKLEALFRPTLSSGMRCNLAQSPKRQFVLAPTAPWRHEDAVGNEYPLTAGVGLDEAVKVL